MFGAIVMIPLYLQLVKGNSATISGLKLIPFMIGIVSMSILSGKLISKHGHYKRYPIMGLILMTIGIALMVTLEINTPFWHLAIFAVLIGMGLGLSMQTIVIALQNSVDFKDMGVSTGANTFFRSVGSTVGVAIFGSIYASKLGTYIPQGLKELATSNPQALQGFTPAVSKAVQNNPTLLNNYAPELKATFLHSYVHAFHNVFMAAAPITLVGLVLALFLRETPLRTGAAHHAAKEEAAGEALA
jgi:MFS family permease